MDCINDMYCFSSPTGMLIIGIILVVAIVGSRW